MASHMKTTVELSSALLLQAKALAAAKRTTLRSLIEEGLRQVLQKQNKAPPFRLRKVSVRGKGLQPELQDGSWEKIRQRLYEGRGG